MIPQIENVLFFCEHIFDSPENELLIQHFTVNNPSGKNLARFLKELASNNEKMNADRTYLVKDKATGEIAGFFALRNGLFVMRGANGEKYTIPSIELSNFAVNDRYKTNHPDVHSIGENIFKFLIIPLAKYIQTLTGIQALYIYALPQERLLEHYSTFGFNRLSAEDEKYIYDSVKPMYDEECIFMYQIL